MVTFTAVRFRMFGDIGFVVERMHEVLPSVYADSSVMCLPYTRHGTVTYVAAVV